MLKEIPIFERPREKALKYGIKSLSNLELLEIILRTGSKDKSVVGLSQSILSNVESLADFKEMTINELLEFKGIGVTKAITILACVEFGERICNERKEDVSFISSEDVYKYMKNKFIGVKEENLYVIYLNAKGSLISVKLMSSGGGNSTLFDGRLILKWAFKLSAYAFILVHNHPSGDETPSMADIKYTKQIIELARVNGFLVLDHIIIGDSYFSMKRDGKLSNLF